MVSILQLEDDPQLKHSYLRKNAFKQYFELVNSMFVYENELFDRYLYKATYMANVEVRKNILAMGMFKKHKGLSLDCIVLILMFVSIDSDSTKRTVSF